MLLADGGVGVYGFHHGGTERTETHGGCLAANSWRVRSNFSPLGSQLRLLGPRDAQWGDARNRNRKHPLHVRGVCDCGPSHHPYAGLWPASKQSVAR